MYECDNQSGFMSWSLCSENAHMACVEDKCIKEEDVPDKQWAVEIEIDIPEPNSTTLEQIAVEISSSCDVNISDFVNGVDYDDGGQIVRIMVFVTDETTAKTIESSISNLKKDESCQGILCRSEKTHARQITSVLSLSGAYRSTTSNLHIISVIIASIMISFIL